MKAVERQAKLGKEFKRLREQQGLSVPRLAAMSEVRRQSIYMLEENDSTPRLDVAIKLCDALGVDLQDVIKGRSTSTMSKQSPSTLVDLERLLARMDNLSAQNRRFVREYVSEAQRQNRKKPK